MCFEPILSRSPQPSVLQELEDVGPNRSFCARKAGVWRLCPFIIAWGWIDHRCQERSILTGRRIRCNSCMQQWRCVPRLYRHRPRHGRSGSTSGAELSSLVRLPVRSSSDRNLFDLIERDLVACVVASSRMSDILRRLHTVPKMGLDCGNHARIHAGQRPRPTGSCARSWVPAPRRCCTESIPSLRGDQRFESLYRSKRVLTGRHCRLVRPGRPPGSRP
jgi:hypothetical protein